MSGEISQAVMDIKADLSDLSTALTKSISDSAMYLREAINTQRYGS